MGQQQLLLIVLGVIIVGIAVVVGINMFSASSVNANRDAVTSDLSNLAAMAQQYYRKPTELGGGGNKFASWDIPANLKSNGNGSYKATVDDDNTVTIVGTGNQTVTSGGTDTVKVTATVKPSAVSMVVNK